MRPPKLDRILAAETALQPVLAKAHDLRALAGLLDGFLPLELAREARVVNYRDGELTIVAATSAAAAKLRLLAPSLVIFFSKQRSQVNSVRLRVQPDASRAKDGAPQKTAYLSTPTLESLRTLYNGMRASPAREALRRLLERRGVNVEEPRPRTGAGSPAGQKRRT